MLFAGAGRCCAIADRWEMVIMQLMQLAAMFEYPVSLKLTPSGAQTSRSRVTLVLVLLLEVQVVAMHRSVTLTFEKLTIDLMRQFLKKDRPPRIFSG
jgi:hypothetical protein